MPEMKVMGECYIVDEEALSRVRDTALFYPCSGNDTSVPIQLFSPHVTDFWFLDFGYFSPGHQDTRHDGLDAPADKQEPILKANHKYRLLDKIIDGPPSAQIQRKRDAKTGKEYRDLEPCTLTEIYQHVPTNRNIRIHRRRGFGFSALRNQNLISSLGVFFYRGDSMGEGGSGDLWLAPDHLNEVCDKLVDGGFIVTDGSQHGYNSNKEYEELWKWQKSGIGKRSLMEPEEIIKSTQPFTDKAGRKFTCVGYAGERYGPTLIWQVRKSIQQAVVPDGKTRSQ